jgi:hypothetical protein
MNGGLIIADHGLPGKFETDEKDISDDIWSFFGSGVSLRELYVNPHKLSESDWDVLARAIKWARENESILADTHWVGGDPGKGEVYGYASWSAEKAVLMLRNPSGKVKSFEVNAREVFEIPPSMKAEFSFYDAIIGGKDLVAKGDSFKVDLGPFEVKVFNCIP